VDGEAARRAYEAQARHLSAERARVAEQIEDLEMALRAAEEREASLRAQLDDHRAEIERRQAEIERLEREKSHLQQLYDGVLEMRAVRWSAAVRRSIGR
jgi:chromosome segregation ATPase